MSDQVFSAAPAPSQTTNRRSANYHPSLWGDHFLSYASNLIMETDDEIEHQKLKDKVERMLMAVVDDSLSKKLDMIDAIQRLGVSYHFESEIDQLVKQIYETQNERDIEKEIRDNDLHTLSLQFRLISQQGYKTSSDVFNKFKDNERGFKESLINDVRGILSLYEATHLRVHGEDILEEALSFTTAHLESLALTQLSPHLAAQITHALKQPLYNGIQRVEARHYISIYEEDASHNEILLSFAKLDFNILLKFHQKELSIQRVEARHYISIYEEDASHNEILLSFAKLDFNILLKFHQKELSEISRWWKYLDFANKLSFARDRVVEGYFWVLAVYFEPKYSPARMILTKVFAMSSIIDDMYDVYGTIEELELFTNAIQWWDINAIEQLPEYMKVVYKALLDVYAEIEEKMANEGKLYRHTYAKEEIKNQVKAYFAEAKWFHVQYVPTLDEYMHVAIATAGYKMLQITSLVGMGDIVTKDAFEWLLSHPKMVTASLIIYRLLNDIVSHKFEQERGHVASNIECYMKQYNATEQEAIDEFRKQITEAWKDMNEECLYPISVPMPILVRVLNFTRVMDVFYKDIDSYTHADIELKDFIASVLVDPVSI